jgi:hypothetical protein
MKVKELLKVLQSLPEDLEIILQKDAEGNDYSPLDTYGDDCWYVAESTWSGQVYGDEYRKEMVEACEEDGEEPEPAIRCLVLAPVN